jgi:hypothetical protein
MVVREVTPQELREYNEKSWKETQNIFRRRLREIAAGGENKARYKVDEYCFGERIQPWLESLGFKVKQVNLSWYEVSWSEANTPDEKKTWHMMVQRGDRKQCHPEADCLKSGNPAWYLYHWKKDLVQWDYICSCCDEHSEYETKFCPNCGAKMRIEEDKNGT